MSPRISFRPAFDKLALKEMDSATLVFAIEDALDEKASADRILRSAMEVAALAHVDQFRKNGITANRDPYIVHPLRNVLRLIRYGCTDIEVLAATALHDTVEDQPASVIRLLSGESPAHADPLKLRRDADRLIARDFGERIAHIVAAVTNPVDMDTSGDGPRSYQSHVIAAITDPSVFLVKFSDYVDNAGSVKYLEKGSQARLLGKYEPLVDSFRQAALSFGDTLGLPTSGLEAIAERITLIEKDFLTLHSEE
ncbi:(p)ppGpp synthase/HD superfamily hydrolase [Rhodococcus sp. 27YEA15]|uniref:hypothetical protein n=1 Tax=Rhodococcus sp. 27YEA15 TaxID=3156259 RepID=UPI003C7D0978